MLIDVPLFTCPRFISLTANDEYLTAVCNDKVVVCYGSDCVVYTVDGVTFAEARGKNLFMLIGRVLAMLDMGSLTQYEGSYPCDGKMYVIDQDRVVCWRDKGEHFIYNIVFNSATHFECKAKQPDSVFTCGNSIYVVSSGFTYELVGDRCVRKFRGECTCVNGQLLCLKGSTLVTPSGVAVYTFPFIPNKVKQVSPRHVAAWDKYTVAITNLKRMYVPRVYGVDDVHAIRVGNMLGFAYVLPNKTVLDAVFDVGIVDRVRMCSGSVCATEHELVKVIRKNLLAPAYMAKRRAGELKGKVEVVL